MVASLFALAVMAQSPRIHCVSDISQEFTFYMDGRFATQYLGENSVDVRNWGTLSKLDLSNANLLVLSSGNTRVPYTRATVTHLLDYVRGGGGLVLMSDGTASDKLPIQAVADAFNVRFSSIPAVRPIVRASSTDTTPLEFVGGGRLATGTQWTSIAVDNDGKPVLAMRTYGKGKVLVGTRGLFGSNPDASDPINQQLIRGLLLQVVSGKRVDASKPPKEQWAELTRQVGPLTLEFHEGTAPFADGIEKEFRAVRPLLMEITGVDPAPGMVTRMLMLPTGGGGFSSGERIAIGAWWGDYPKNRYPMVELISHEAGHSWVLPHPEPVWNEPIATYLGILVGRKLGMKEADETLKSTIAAARTVDPDLTKFDIGQDDTPRNVVWGKTFFLFEELDRLYGPGAIKKYFLAKRRLAPASRPGYTMDDAVAVWSAAVGKDLFPWFRSYGLDVMSDRTDIPLR